MDFFTQYDTYIWGAFLIIGTWIFTKVFGRKHKEISCTIENIAVIWKAKPIAPSQLKILFDDLPINYLEVITLRLSNTGRIPILGSDLLEPITIHLEPLTKILSVNVESSSMKLKLSEQSTSVEITFDLMNQTDLAIINITCDRASKLYITQRVIGVSNLNFRSITNITKLKITYLICIVVLIGCIFAMIFMGDSLSFSKAPILTFAILISLVLPLIPLLVYSTRALKDVIRGNVSFHDRLTQNKVKF